MQSLRSLTAVPYPVSLCYRSPACVSCTSENKLVLVEPYAESRDSVKTNVSATRLKRLFSIHTEITKVITVFFPDM